MNEKKLPRRSPSRRDAVETRSKLMIEAGKAFALHGFDGANLRDICKAAEVNLGAVRYYFGSKKELYREALIQPHLQMMKEDPLSKSSEVTTPENALRYWIGFAMRITLLRRREHPYLSKLMMREFVSPTFVLDELIQTVFKDVRGELLNIVSALTGVEQGDRNVGELANIIMLLCTQHEMSREVLERFNYPPPSRENEINELADKIYKFALAGIRTWG